MQTSLILDGGDLHVHYYHALVLKWCTVGHTLDTYGFDWSRDYEEWDFYVQYASQGGVTTANVDYDGTLWNLAVGYDLDEDDKLGLIMDFLTLEKLIQLMLR